MPAENLKWILETRSAPTSVPLTYSRTAQETMPQAASQPLSAAAKDQIDAMKGQIEAVRVQMDAMRSQIDASKDQMDTVKAHVLEVIPPHPPTLFARGIPLPMVDARRLPAPLAGSAPGTACECGVRHGLAVPAISYQNLFSDCAN
jgi:hypothetical protein